MRLWMRRMYYVASHSKIEIYILYCGQCVAETMHGRDGGHHKREFTNVGTKNVHIVAIHASTLFWLAFWALISSSSTCCSLLRMRSSGVIPLSIIKTMFKSSIAFVITFPFHADVWRLLRLTCSDASGWLGPGLWSPEEEPLGTYSESFDSRLLCKFLIRRRSSSPFFLLLQ